MNLHEEIMAFMGELPEAIGIQGKWHIRARPGQSERLFDLAARLGYHGTCEGCGVKAFNTIRHYIGLPPLESSVPHSTWKARTAQCNTCPELSGDKCSKCGCLAIDKAATIGETCPLNRWEA